MAEMKNEQGVEQQKEKTAKQRVKDILKRIHFDKIKHLSPEQAELSKKVTGILYDALDLNNLNRWSVALRDEYPKGTEVTLVGEKDGQLLKPITVPLHRPEVFLKMYETYLETGEVPQELIHDNAEEEVPHDEEDADEQERDYSQDIQEYHDWIAEANTVEKLMRVQKSARQEFGAGERRQFGISTSLDEKAEKLILDEITTGTPDKLQLALRHLDTYKFESPEIGENLRTLLESQTSSEEILQMPSKVSEFEKRAAAAESIDDIAAIAKSVPENDTRVRRSIDNLAKTKFIETCKAISSIDEFKDALGEARRFPFYDSVYGEDVRFIVEANAKSFILGEIKKGSTIEELNTIQEKAREFRFAHNENLTDINNEIVIKREKIGGNELSVQRIENEENANTARYTRGRVLRDIPTGRSNEPTLGRPADRQTSNRQSILQRLGRFLTNQNPNE